MLGFVHHGSLGMSLFAPPAGLCLELLGDRWFAYSPLSGETSILNDEGAAVIEVLSEGPGTVESVCNGLRVDSGMDRPALVQSIDAAWSQLVQAGLIVESTSMTA